MEPEEYFALLNHYRERSLSSEEHEQVLKFESEHKGKLLSILAKLSLEKKWYKDAEFSIHELCPFCLQSCVALNEKWVDNDNSCEVCLCPPKICANSATEGIIVNIEDEYEKPDLCVNDLSEWDLERIQKLFRKYI